MRRRQQRLGLGRVPLRLLNPPAPRGDLSVTALYTAQTWSWGGFDGADLLSSRDGRFLFALTNLALWVAGPFGRGPALRHGLVQRHTMIDTLLREAGAAQVLELAAGLSRRGASFSDDPAVRYVEVDLPHVVAHKEALLGRTEAGREVADRPNLRRVAGDVATVHLAELVDDGPVFVIAEGLLMYLQAEQQRALWQRVADLVRERPGSRFVFDLVPAVEQPRAGMRGRVLGRIMRVFTGGRGFAEDERTRHDVRVDLEGCGFSEVVLLEPADVDGVPHLDRRTHVLVFACR